MSTEPHDPSSPLSPPHTSTAVPTPSPDSGQDRQQLPAFPPASSPCPRSVSPAVPLPAPVAILGAGRLGLQLTWQLRQVSQPPHFVWNRSSLRGPRDSFFTHPASTPPPELLVGPLPAQLRQARLVLICVVDDAIKPLAEELAAANLLSPGCLVMHTSGALSVEALSPLENLGLELGSLHPLQAFSYQPAEGIFRGTFFALEGSEAVMQVGEQLVQCLEGRALRLRPGGKLLYHTSAVMASNLMVALTSLATEVLRPAVGADVSPEARLDILLPLLEGTVLNLRRVGLPRALTGPVSRGDTGVVARQLKALEDLDPQRTASEALTPLYRRLSLEALSLAKAQGLPESTTEALARLLELPADPPR